MLGQDLVQRRVFLLGGKGGRLLLGPSAVEEGDDACLARQKRGCIARISVRLEEGLAVEVGEEERELRLEESWWGNEGFALVVLQVAPISEIRSRYFGRPV